MQEQRIFRVFKNVAWGQADEASDHDQLFGSERGAVAYVVPHAAASVALGCSRAVEQCITDATASTGL